MGLENVATLNGFLADKSYIVGYTPSQADVVVFEAHKSAPAADNVHALRWWNHINSFGAKRASFPGEKKDLASYAPAEKKEEKKADDDDFDLFAEDEEVDEEAERIKKERIAAYEAKKAGKPVLIAKSSIVLDVKPWDDETNMKELEEKVRGIEMDGLLWGASKLQPVAFGVKKLQITCVVEDDKVSVDQLEELITGFEDHVQSVDIASFNKI